MRHRLWLLLIMIRSFVCSCFFFNDTATTEIYTLSLHDALPIYRGRLLHDALHAVLLPARRRRDAGGRDADRKSTRLNSSHTVISYAVFCLKKKMLSKQYDLSI